jgi:hypothetical protein
MLPLDKVERIKLAPHFEIIYDREKVKKKKNLFPQAYQIIETPPMSTCLPSAFLIVRCISTSENPLSLFSVSKPMVLNKEHRLYSSKTLE